MTGLNPSQQTKENENRPLAYLEGLRLFSLKSGADDAVIIPSSDVIVDPRVRFKCMIPKCYMSGSCEHCPPYGYSIKEVRSIVEQYEWAIFFRKKVKSSIIAAAKIHEAIDSGIMDDKGNAINLGGHYILVFTIVKLLQKKAGEMGYDPTHGFAAGNCRDPFCHLQPTCQNLITDKGCRHPELSSPSMESSGMDVYKMAARAGWDQFPIGGMCEPESIPQGSLMGLILIK